VVVKEQEPGEGRGGKKKKLKKKGGFREMSKAPDRDKKKGTRFT